MLQEIQKGETVQKMSGKTENGVEGYWLLADSFWLY